MAKNGTGDRKLFVVNDDEATPQETTITDPETTLTAHPFRFTLGLGVLIKDGNGKIIGEQDLSPVTVYDQDDAVEIIQAIKPEQVSENG